MIYQYVLEDIRDRTKYEPNLDELPPEIKSRVHRLAKNICKDTLSEVSHEGF